MPYKISKHLRRKKAFYYIIITLFLTLFTSSGLLYSKLSNAPNFVMYSAQGQRYIFYDIVKKLPADGLLIFNFTSIYCRPCKKEIPELLHISKKAGKRAKLICVYAEAGSPVKENASKLGVLDSAYVDPFGKIQKKFNVKKLPVTIVINREHAILGRFVGYTEDNIKKIRKLLLN